MSTILLIALIWIACIVIIAWAFWQLHKLNQEHFPKTQINQDEEAIKDFLLSKEDTL